MPNAIIEAMSIRLPIVGTFGFNDADLAENKINGHIVNEENIEDYCSKINLALKVG